MPDASLYVVVIDSGCLRDAQVKSYGDVPEDVLAQGDDAVEEYIANNDLYKDCRGDVFVAVVFAKSAKDAVDTAAERTGYDKRILSAIQIPDARRESEPKELKIFPEYADAVVAGQKNFEIRRNDRDFEVGDRVVFRAYLPEIGYINHPIDGKEYEITYVFRGGGKFGLADGYVVFGMRERVSQ